MKKFLYLFLVSLFLVAPVRATDITIISTTVPYANITDLGASRTGTASVVNGNSAITLGTALPSNYVGLTGFQIKLGSAIYYVTSVDSTTQITLQGIYTASTGSVSFEIYPFVLLRVFASKNFIPLGAGYVVQSGNSTTGTGFFKQIAATYRLGQLYLPDIVLQATTDLAETADRDVRYTIWFYRLNGSQIRVYDGFQSFRMPHGSSSTTWPAIKAYNTPSTTITPNFNAYNTDQVNSLFESIPVGNINTGDPSKVLVSDSTGKVETSTVPASKLTYIGGLASDAQVQIDAKAGLASPTFTGTPAGPTASTTTASTQLATTAFTRYQRGKLRVIATASLPSSTYSDSAAVENGDKVQLSDGNLATVTYRTGIGWVNDDPVVRPENFGVLFDGSTDSTLAFSAAITAAQALNYPIVIPVTSSGCVIDTITISGSLVIEGAGPGAKILRKASATNSPMFDVSGGSLTLRNFTIDGQRSTVTTRKALIEWNAGSTTGRNFTAEGMIFQNAFTPLYLKNLNGSIKLTKSQFLEVAPGDGGVSYPNTTIAVFVSGGTGNVEVDDCRFVNTYAPADATLMPGGIEVHATSASSQITTKVVNSYFEKFGCDNVLGAVGAVDLYDFGKDSVIANNRFINSYASAIKVANAPQLVVQGNIIKGSRSAVDSAAIYVSGAARSSTGIPFHNFTIIGNTVTGWDNYVMQLQGASGNIPKRWNISNNTFDGNKRGVIFGYVGDIELSNNTISNGTGTLANESSALYLLNMAGQTLRVKGGKILDNPSYGILADDSSNDTATIEVEGTLFRSSSTDNIRWSSATATGTFRADGAIFEGTQRSYLLNLGGSGATVKIYDSRTASGATAPSLTATNVYKAGNDFDAQLYSASTTLRKITLPDASATLAGLGVSQTFSVQQTFSAGISVTGGNVNITGGTVTDRAAQLSSEAQGNSMYFGHPNSGYKNAIGALSSTGYPFFCFYCYHSSTANTFKRSSASNLPFRFQATNAGELDFYIAPAGTVDADISDFAKVLTINSTGVVNSGTPQTLTGPGAVSLTTYATLLVTTGADALTLAAGTEGQSKFIRMKTDGGDGTLTVTNLQGGTTITFNDAGDFVLLFYLDAKWHILTNSGCTVA